MSLTNNETLEVIDDLRNHGVLDKKGYITTLNALFLDKEEHELPTFSQKSILKKLREHYELKKAIEESGMHKEELIDIHGVFLTLKSDRFSEKEIKDILKAKHISVAKCERTNNNLNLQVLVKRGEDGEAILTLALNELRDQGLAHEAHFYYQGDLL